MVVGAFPAAKLGVLAIKQISKPIANVIKSGAKNNPFFRKYICMPPAHFYNWMEVKYKMWVMNLGKPINIPQLTEPMAIELGSNLLGEFIIFSIGAALVIFEYVRSSSKDARKEEVLKKEKFQMNMKINDLGFRVEQQDAKIREMTRILADLDSRFFFKFSKKKQVLPPEKETRPEKLSGNYNPSYGVIFEALNYIETEIFKDKS